MKLTELLELFSLPHGENLYLQDYEIDMLLERAKEYKMPKDEYQKLLEGIERGIFEIQTNHGRKIYNLITMEEITLDELSRMYNITTVGARLRIENKKCFNGVPYSYDIEDIPLFYQINQVPLYECSGMEGKRPAKCWRKIFNDNINISYYSNGIKYKGKHKFTRVNKLYLEVL